MAKNGNLGTSRIGRLTAPGPRPCGWRLQKLQATTDSPQQQSPRTNAPRAQHVTRTRISPCHARHSHTQSPAPPASPLGIGGRRSPRAETKPPTNRRPASLAMAAAASLNHLLLAPKPRTHPNPSRPPSRSITPQPRRRPPATAISAVASDFLSPAPSLKSRLAAGDTLYGLFLLSFSPTLAEVAALAGYDYVVVDMEHGPGGIPEALACLRALDAARTPAVLRLPEASAVWAKKALDLGPAGLMLPAVESPAAAVEAVSHCRYPPRGVRGAAHPIVRASAYGLDDSYLSRCEDDTLIMCQVETAAGIAEIDAIAAVDGVDVVHMGPLDLSASMGYLWDPGNRKVRATLREAEKKVLEARKKKVATALDGNAAYLGGFAMQHDPPEQLKLRGYHMVSGTVDIAMFRKAALDDVKRFREAVMEIGEDDDEEGDKEEKENDGYWSE